MQARETSTEGRIKAVGNPRCFVLDVVVRRREAVADNVNEDGLSRSHGNVDLLLGVKRIRLLPKVVASHP